MKYTIVSTMIFTSKQLQKRIKQHVIMSVPNFPASRSRKIFFSSAKLIATLNISIFTSLFMAKFFFTKRKVLFIAVTGNFYSWSKAFLFLPFRFTHATFLNLLIVIFKKNTYFSAPKLR